MTKKSKTIYTSKKNVDISSIINNNDKTSIIAQNGRFKNSNIKSKNNNDSYSINDMDYGNSDNDSDNNSDDDQDDDNINDKDDISPNDIDNIIDKEDDDNDFKNDDNDYKDDDDNEVTSQKSDKDNDSLIDDKEEKDYIDNEDILKSKCYSKYASVDYDELDFDELFGEETLVVDKNIKLSKPFLTKYEFVRLLTDRTKQLAQGAKPMLKNINGLSTKEIAKLELKNKIIPLIIERPIPNSHVERWKLSELEIPDYLFI